MPRLITALLAGWGMLLAASPAPALERIDIFACEPEWGALAREIGGNRVDVDVAANPGQDVHYMRARPSLLADMRAAELVFCSGAGLEVGWLPILMRKAAGPDIQPGTPGYLMAAEQVKRLGIPERVDRAMGDIHPEGNPHIHTDPRRILQVAHVLTQRLGTIDPDHAGFYEDRLAGFETAWQKAIKKWEHKGRTLSSARFIVYHKSWAYLADWLGFEIFAALEPKPGIPPSTAHQETILEKVRGREIAGILVAPHEDDDAANWLHNKTGIPVIKLPYTVGGAQKTEDLYSLFDITLARLTARAGDGH